MKKHFVTFMSPGTFVSESTEKPIHKWDIKTAMVIAREIKERYNATPYCFYFSTKVVSEEDVIVDGESLKVEPKVIEESGAYHINGKVLILDDIPETKENSILRDNMRINGIPAVVETRNSWKHTAPLEKKDIVLNARGEIIARGEDYYKKKAKSSSRYDLAKNSK